MQEPRGGDCINLKTKWAALEALVGDPKRIALIAADLVAQLTPSPAGSVGLRPTLRIVCLTRPAC